ncbi:MAG: type II toxin-antitoxin system HicA family toxin [Nitrososphaerales archaeon]|jgi:predicted RNA binding protein YcfA (HicA-like mRNA interferase family)
MTVLKSNEVIKGLTKKGFRKAEGDHAHLVLHSGDKMTSIRTKVSHGSKGEINDSLISKMSAQIKLEKTEFVDLVKCPLSQEQYFVLLKDRGYPSILSSLESLDR